MVTVTQTLNCLKKKRKKKDLCVVWADQLEPLLYRSNVRQKDSHLLYRQVYTGQNLVHNTLHTW